MLTVVDADADDLVSRLDGAQELEISSDLFWVSSRYWGGLTLTTVAVSPVALKPSSMLPLRTVTTEPTISEVGL